MPALPMIASIATIASAVAVTGKTLLTKPPEAPPIPEAPKPVDTKKLTDDAEKRQSALAEQARKRMGGATRGGTMLTGPGGAVGAAPVQRKTLLGG